MVIHSKHVLGLNNNTCVHLNCVPISHYLGVQIMFPFVFPGPQIRTSMVSLSLYSSMIGSIMVLGGIILVCGGGVITLSSILVISDYSMWY